MTLARAISVFIFSTMALAVGVSAVAAQELPRPPVQSAPATQQGLGATSSNISLDLNSVRYITLAVPVRKIVLGNEQVADIHLEPNNPRQVFIVSKSVGTTNAYFMDAAGQIIQQLEISVTLGHGALKAALKKLLPDEDIDVTVFGGNIFLKGNARTAASAATAVDIAQRFVTGTTSSVTNMLQVLGSQQVILQVRVTEMSRAIRKNLAASTSLTRGTTRGFNIKTTATTPTLTAFGSGALQLGLQGIGTTTVSALERQSLAKTLAEPTLTATSGQSASFLSGGEIPVPTGVDQNGNAIITYREYGIRLNFTPTVLDQGRINLKVSTEISAIDTNNTVTLSNLTVNGFTAKRTETTVDLPSGGSLMMSGLLQDNINDVISGLPFLKDIPVLGALFRSTEFQRDETELVVTVTAYLAKPTGNNAKLAVPTDGFEPASDIDIYLLGRLHREYGKGERPFWKDPLKGPFGYIMR